MTASTFLTLLSTERNTLLVLLARHLENRSNIPEMTSVPDDGDVTRVYRRRLARGEPSGGGKTELSQVEEEAVIMRLEIYRQRKQRVRKVCEKYGLGNTKASIQMSNDTKYKTMEDTFPWPPEKSLMLQPSWHLLYCWIHKVASTSWSEVFFYLRGKEVPASRLHEATQYFSLRSHGMTLESALSSSLVFTIVRHPLERLVSAYRDKFEFAKKFAYIYNHYAHQVLNTTAAGSRTSRRPSFSDFVNYLLRTPVDQYNDHWVPYWLHCHLCEVEYDVIAKMETITEDTDFISDRSGLSSFNISLPWSNKKRPREDVTSEYIKQLSLTQLRRLYEIYKPDFEMFDYSIEPYLRLFDPEQQP